jgi:hypothetical protein
MRNPAGALALTVALAVTSDASQPRDPFAFFGPSAPLTIADRERLARDEPVVRTTPARGQSVAVFAIVPVAITGDRLVMWIRDIAAFKKGPPVLQAGRFSDPPRLDDLARLTFPDGDIDDLRSCVPGDCALKITRAEMAAAQSELAARPPSEHQDVLRALLMQRVETYLASGFEAVAPYVNNEKKAPPALLFSTLVAEANFLPPQPEVGDGVETSHPSNGRFDNGTESFLYWAKEHYGGKPIVSVMHVFVIPPQPGGPEVFIVSKQIFATHYIDGWLGVTALARDPTSGQAYFVYVVRSSVDVIQGFWGGIVRRVLQRRLKSDGVALMNGIRQRLERGLPPSTTPATVTPRR